jgi:hypothetical protein
VHWCFTRKEVYGAAISRMMGAISCLGAYLHTPGDGQLAEGISGFDQRLCEHMLQGRVFTDARIDRMRSRY